MKTRILRHLSAMLLCISLTFPLSSCAESGVEKKAYSVGASQKNLNYCASKLELPEALGKPVALAYGDGNLCTGGNQDGSSSLFLCNLKENEWMPISATPFDLGKIVGLAASEDTLFIFSESAPNSLSYLMTVYDLKAKRAAGQYRLDGLDNEDIDFWGATDTHIVCLTSYGKVITFSHAGENFSRLETDGKVSATAIVNNELLLYEKNKKLCELSAFDLSANTSALIHTTDVVADVSYSSGGSVVFGSDTSLYSFDRSDQSIQYLFNWLDIGIEAILGVGSLTALDNGEFLLVDRAASSIYHIKPGESKERKPLVIGCGEGTYGPFLPKAVALFNGANRDYIARIETYSFSETDGLLAAISAGKGPDILYLGSSTLAENPFSKISVDNGVFVDLLPYLDADPELSRADFIPSVLAAMSVENELCSLIPFFCVETLVMPARLSDGMDAWGMPELLRILDELPEGFCLFKNLRQETLLNRICDLASVDYVDLAKGACYFDDPSFAQWLALCKSLDYHDDNRHDGFALEAPSIASLNGPGWYRKDFGGDYAYAGYPSRSEDIVYFSSLTGGFSILESSENKDAAWALLRILLTSEIQDDSLYGFPVTAAPFEKLLSTSTKNEDTDFTKEDRLKLESLIAQGEAFAQGSAISAIIGEEAENYFAGHKTLDDTIRAIQSRAMIYVSEQS